jgi:proline iminopeptidase
VTARRDDAGRLVDIGGVRLHVVERGRTGFPLVCLHGGPGVDHLTFADYLDGLAPEVRVVLVDLRGHGRSDDGPAGSLVLPQLAADVAALADALELGQYAVLGHSWGATVALRLAVDLPSAPAAIVLSAGTPSPAALPNAASRVAHASPELRARLDAAPDFETWFAEYVAACFADERDPRIAEYLDRRRDMVVRLDSAERLRERRAEGELEHRLGEVCARTLVLHGVRDRTTPPGLARRLAAGIPGAQLRLFERSGHFPFVEEPYAYLSAVREFVCRPASSAAQRPDTL